jgi:hypothetical protein
MNYKKPQKTSRKVVKKMTIGGKQVLVLSKPTKKPKRKKAKGFFDKLFS